MRPYYLKGIVKQLKDKNKILLENESIGYLLEVIDSSSYKVDQETILFVHEFQYEEKYSLYGFSNEENLVFFELLLNVKGVGPKTAMNLFRKITPEKLKTLIIEQSPQSIASLGELGPITSTEIVSSLRLKMKREGVKPRSKEIINVIKAAKQLGFKEKDIEPLVDEIEDVSIGEGELLKSILNQLRSGKHEK